MWVGTFFFARRLFLPIGAALKAAAVFAQHCKVVIEKMTREVAKENMGEETVEEKKFVFNRNPHITPFQARKQGEAKRRIHRK